MSQRERGGEESSLGNAREVGRSPIQELAPVQSATAATPRPSSEDTSIGKTSAVKSEASSVVPLTPTTPTTLEAATTGTESEHSSERGRDEGETSEEQHPRQVIAVSVSKGPSAFFNLARKFLVTDEECDLSALEGAIVSAVDAAHLLERSKIATITRIKTSYVSVEPKKKKDQGQESTTSISEAVEESPQTQFAAMSLAHTPRHSHALDTLAAAAEQGRAKFDQSTAATETSSTSSTTRPLRRARIVITVRRTEAYKKWLEENPLQDIISGEDDDRI